MTWLPQEQELLLILLIKVLFEESNQWLCLIQFLLTQTYLGNRQAMYHQVHNTQKDILALIKEFLVQLYASCACD